MSIVATEAHVVGETTGRHLVFYRCQDHTGKWHDYGPVHAAAGFDAEAHKAIVAERVARHLAEAEAAGVME